MRSLTWRGTAPVLLALCLVGLALAPGSAREASTRWTSLKGRLVPPHVHQRSEPFYLMPIPPTWEGPYVSPKPPRPERFKVVPIPPSPDRLSPRPPHLLQRRERFYVVPATPRPRVGG
jgi:hypothetical protein